MRSLKLEEFDSPNFNAEKYTKQLLKECVGGQDLLKCKKEIQVHSEQTAAALKKVVYANYMRFIETAKEISHLESDLTQLSLLLQEQRNVLSTLAGDKSTSTNRSGNLERDLLLDQEQQRDHHPHMESREDQMPEDQEQKNLQAIRAIREMIPNYPINLDGKTFLNQGALTELDGNDYRPLQRVFFFLLNDVWIICKVKHDKRLEFLNEYDPRKIAVINIKDLDGVKNAINIITPDGSKIFQSITAASKIEWIEKFEVALRWDQQQNKQSLNKLKKSINPPKLKPSTSSSMDSGGTVAGSGKNSMDDHQSSMDMSSHEEEEKLGPDWLQSAPDEIHTLIAQRHFEDAETLIKRCRDYLQMDNKFSNADDIDKMIQQTETDLTSVLLHELPKNHSRNLQVVLRSSRRSLQILVKMGKARQACTTLLKVCSIALRGAQREARRNNAEISELFFCDLAQVVCEFMMSFESQPACVSALVVWANTELQYFAGQLKKHYLTKGSNLETIANCTEGVRKPCAKLTEIGLDLSYHLEGLLRLHLEDLIKDSRDRLLETMGRTEDLWQPYNLQTKSNLKRMLMDLDRLGLDVKTHAIGDTWINLTQSTVNFSKHFLQISNHCAHLAKSESLVASCQLLLRDLWQAQYTMKPSLGLSVDPNFVYKNKQFLLDELLPVAIGNFERISSSGANTLRDTQTHYGQQVSPGGPVPKRRSVYKTEI